MGLKDAFTSFYRDLTGIQQSNQGYKLKSLISEENLNPGVKALFMDLVDPLSLNFKVLIDPSPTSGLMAPYKGPDGKVNVNSALAYLVRIGENGRAYMLERWIESFNDLMVNYEFLLEEVEGLDDIYGHSLNEAWIDYTLKLKFRETIDSRVVSHLTILKEILHDSTRNVEVLPGNLTCFPLHILVYSAGYYNPEFYSVDTNFPEDDYVRNVLPTSEKLNVLDNINKLNRGDNNVIAGGPFNHHLFSFPSLGFNLKESGKSYFSSVTNNSNDMVKTEYIFSYRSVGYSGTFNNVFGAFNFSNMLAGLAAEKARNARYTVTDEGFLVENDNISNMRGFIDKVKTNINGDWGTNFANSMKNILPSVANNLKNTALVNTTRYTEMVDKWAGNVADSIVQLTDPNLLNQLVTNNVGRFTQKFVDNGRAYVENKLGLNDFNAFMTANLADQGKSFLSDIVGKATDKLTSKLFGEGEKPIKSGVSMLSKQEINPQGPSVYYEPQEVNDLGAGVSYEKYEPIQPESVTNPEYRDPITGRNIFNRRSF